jgi:hypothetical protein
MNDFRQLICTSTVFQLRKLTPNSSLASLLALFVHSYTLLYINPQIISETPFSSYLLLSLLTKHLQHPYSFHIPSTSKSGWPVYVYCGVNTSQFCKFDLRTLTGVFFKGVNMLLSGELLNNYVQLSRQTWQHTARGRHIGG